MTFEDSLNTSKLEPGMVVKNYKELCKLIGESPQGGNAKKAQLYNWSRFFKFEKPEKKKCYNIIEIYEDPIKEKHERGRNPIYLKNIEIILLDYLVRQKNLYESMTKKKWMCVLGMCNESFTNKAQYNEIVKNRSYIGTNRIDAFFGRTYMGLSNIFMSALRSLQNKKLIECNTEIIIRKNNKFHDASDAEHSLILSLERYVMFDDMGYDTMKDLIKDRKQPEYYKKVNELVQKALNCDWYYRQICIAYSADSILEVLDDDIIKQQKAELNEKVIDFVKRKEQTIATKLENNYLTNKTKFYDPDYYKKSLELIKDFLEIDPNKLVNTRSIVYVDEPDYTDKDDEMVFEDDMRDTL